MKILTKSKYMNGLQCLKLLWIACNEKEKMPAVSESSQHIFDQGTLVGNFAKKLFPKGIEIKADYWDFAGSDEKSMAALKQRKPLFEAGFLSGRIYSRADILVPAGKDEWDIIEVKSGAEVKDENIQDVAFQKHSYEKRGLKIRKCFILHINSKYVRRGRIDASKLFVKEDITELVSDAIKGIEGRIAKMLETIESRKCPEIKIGPQCKKPYECGLKDYCFGKLSLTSVFNLYRIGERAFELNESGVKNIEDIPANYELNEKQLIQHKCAKSGKPCIHREKIKEFLKTLSYPLYFMDFETYSTAIPLYSGLRPYQPIPFQFSVHVIEKEGGPAKHYSFIAEGSRDPRKKFMEELRKVLGGESKDKIENNGKGTILVYFQSFEKGRLDELGKKFPKSWKWIESVKERIADLIIPFTNFYYYSSAQEGSASLKHVLPAVTGKSYDGMEIANGENASLRYLYITHGAFDGTKASGEEIRKIRQDLEEYCGLDTEGMVWILERLRETCGGKE